MTCDLKVSAVMGELAVFVNNLDISPVSSSFEENERCIMRERARRRCQKAELYSKMENWEKADHLYSRAAAEVAQWKKLCAKETVYLCRVACLRLHAEKLFVDAQIIIESLDKTDLEKFWIKQTRNKGVEKVDNLITMRRYMRCHLQTPRKK